MAQWTFWYGDRSLVGGLNDDAKTSLQDLLRSTLAQGRTAWFTGGPAVGAGAFSFLIAPGIPFSFTSDDAVVGDLKASENEEQFKLG